MQLHIWEDRWAKDERWQEALGDLKREGVIDAVGISVNRWEPANCLAALDTGLIDVIQVIYNIFDQAPQDELFPRALADRVGVIAGCRSTRAPWSARCRPDSTWPDGDWRNSYFGPENLEPSVRHYQALTDDAGTDEVGAGCRPPSWRCGSSWLTRR